MTIERLAEAPLILYDARCGADDPTRRQLAERAQRAGVTIEPRDRGRVRRGGARPRRCAGSGDTIGARRVALGRALRAAAAPASPFDPPLYDTFAFITRRDAHLSPATRAFMELAEERLAGARRAVGRHAGGIRSARWPRTTRPSPKRSTSQTIFWLQEAGLPMTGANVARAMQLSAPTVHEMIGRLERDGYITRGADKAHRASPTTGREHAEAHRPPPPADRALPHRRARHPVGRGPRGGRAARARDVAGARGAHARRDRRRQDLPARPPDQRRRAHRGRAAGRRRAGRDGARSCASRTRPRTCCTTSRTPASSPGLEGTLVEPDDDEVTVELRRRRTTTLTRSVAETVSVVADPSPPPRMALPEQLVLAKDRYGR